MEHELKRRLRKGKDSWRICLAIAEKTVKKTLQAIDRADGLTDFIELRVDHLERPVLEPLLAAWKKPLIVTNRRREEGGQFKGDEKERLALLQEAIDLGASYVDVELGSGPASLRALRGNRKDTRLILSFHDFQKTPSPADLRILLERMGRYGAEVVKIVSFARSFEDNLKILPLIPYARRRKKKIVAFCMGEKGKMSRIFAPVMGAAWTYASPSGQKTSAPGQLTAMELRQIWGRMG